MRRPPRAGERGVALILVTWVFMTLGVLALDFSRYMRDDAMASMNLADETRGYYLAIAGLNSAIYELTLEREEAAGLGSRQIDGEEADAQDLDGDGEPDQRFPADAAWHQGDFAGGRYEVRVTDQGGLISLNKAPPAVIRRVVSFVVLGGSAVTGVDRHEQSDVDTIVDSIIDWRDCNNDSGLNGAESDYYLGLRRPYRAKNGFFDSPEELLYVRGVTPDLFYGHDGMPGFADIFSAQSHDAQLHVGTMAPAVAQALLGVDASTYRDLSDEWSEGESVKEGQLRSLLLESFPEIEHLLTEDPPKTVLIEARADTTAVRNRASVAAVVEIASDDYEGPRVLQWYDRAPPREDEAPGTGDGATS